MTPKGILCPHLTWAEALHTDHRLYMEENHNPPQSVRRNMVRHAGTIWLPARKLVGPILVTSFYRCHLLNAAVGGATKSRHMFGLATDNVPLEMSLFDAYLTIAESDIPFDALIYEYGRWCHMQSTLVPSATPRRLLLMKWAGSTEKWDPADPRVQKVRKAQKLNGQSHGANHP